MSQRYERKAALRHHDIIGAISAYLTANKRDPELIKKISNGVCAGLGRFNYYGHKLAKRKKTLGRERDDLDWYNKTMSELIRRYDNHIAFPTKKEDAFYQDFERLISHLVGIGGYHTLLYDDQQSGFLLLADTADFAVEIEYDLASPLTANDFTKELKLHGKSTTLIDVLVQEGKMTEINSGKHETYLTKENGNLYAYDSNDPSGDRVLISNLKQLGRRIVRAHGDAEHFMLLIADLKEPKSKDEKEQKTCHKITYPALSDIFNQLDFVRNKTDVNQPDRRGFTPLYYAALWENKALARELMARGADPNAIASNGWTPLYLALFARGNLTDFSMLEILGAKPSLINYIKNHFADVSKLHQLIVSLTKTYSLDPVPESYKKLNQSITDVTALFIQTQDAERAFRTLRDQAVEIINLESSKNKRTLISLFTKPSELPGKITQALKNAGIQLEQSPENKTEIALEDRARDCLAAFKRIITETDFSSRAESKELKTISVDSTQPKKSVPEVIKDLWFSLNLADPNKPFENLKELSVLAKDHLAKQTKSDDNTYRFCEFVVKQTETYLPKVGLRPEKKT